MARGTRPPPLTITPPPTRRTTIVRESRFIEPPMDEYTPPNSIWEEDEEEGEPSVFIKRLRIANDGLHFVTCLVLMLIMGTFLNTMRRALSTATGYVLSQGDRERELIVSITGRQPFHSWSF